jgi:hypothetical protein
MPGPLPDPNARRGNTRTIPTTTLNASGPSGPRPDIPKWVTLNTAGMKWWKWAWRTPQACAWGANVGMESLIARRASLEDDLAALERANTDVVDMAELLDQLEQGESIRWLFQRLVSMTSGRLSIQKEMREIDDRLGLTPKGLAALRWVIVEDAGAIDEADAAAEEAAAEDADELAARRARLASGDA